ncbi:MAG TPA: type II toxin-antitoxin system prevent-host-death family antitoxin [Aliidongia sp.]|nr:type II toxin-antitoxin system prevent-host-death family antitoxin [Aliidongia sp.]
METFKIYAAKTHFSELIDRVSAGERIMIAKGDKPVAMLVPIGDQLAPREPVAILTGDIDETAWREADLQIEDLFVPRR